MIYFMSQVPPMDFVISKQDPLHGKDAYRKGMSPVASSYWEENNNHEIVTNFNFTSLNPMTRDSGFSINLDNYILEENEHYTLSFDVSLPSGLSLLTNNRFGVKHSTSQLSSFDVDPDSIIVMTDRSQTVTMTFTAGQNNYFNIIFGALTQSGKSFSFTNIKIAKVTT